jgi:hypothetical protein
VNEFSKDKERKFTNKKSDYQSQIKITKIIKLLIIYDPGISAYQLQS